MNTIFKKFVYSIFINIEHTIFINRIPRRDIGNMADPLVWIHSLLKSRVLEVWLFGKDFSGQRPSLAYVTQGCQSRFLPFIINKADSRGMVR